MKATEERFREFLLGHVCTSLLRQEYWFRGDLVEGANVLFIGTGDGRWARFFFDGGVFFWREQPPDAVVAWDGHDYPLIDMTDVVGIRGVRVGDVRFEATRIGMAASLSVDFANATTLLLTNQDDRNEVEVRRQE